jgi:acyl dehydratase
VAATPEFKAQVRAALEAAEIGQSYTFRRTFTEGDVTAFVGISGDFNPYHIDEEFARQSWYGRRTIPGLLTASMVTHIGGMLGFIATEMAFEFLAPVYIGDTITCTLTVQEIDRERRRLGSEAVWLNTAGQTVLRARIGGFPSHPRLAPDRPVE